MPLSLTLKVGQVVHIGEGTSIKLVERSGKDCARIVIQSDQSPIKVSDNGKFPEPRTRKPPSQSPDDLDFGSIHWGITGVPQRVEHRLQ